LRDLGELNSSAGRLSTAILIAQDLLVIPMLLTIGVLQDGALSASDITQTGIALAVISFSLFCIFELHTHPQWLLRIENILTVGKRQPVIAGLALCFGAAALSGALGLSTAYGAFALGLLVGNMGEIGSSYRHAITPLHDLLLMVFFLSVGLLLDLAFVIENMFVICSILIAVVLLKTAGNYLILRLLSIPDRTAIIMGATLGQIGEFSFVLIALGLSSGFITDETYQITLAVIALSLALSPAWLSLVRARLHIPEHYPNVKV
jgi:monovalent cation:H+ antiporter-2, CPA2 family